MTLFNKIQHDLFMAVYDLKMKVCMEHRTDAVADILKPFISLGIFKLYFHSAGRPIRRGAR